MSNAATTAPKIKSMAAPTDQDLADFEVLCEDDKLRVVEAEIEKGLQGKARKVSPQQIIAAVKARRDRG